MMQHRMFSKKAHMESNKSSKAVIKIIHTVGLMDFQDLSNISQSNRNGINHFVQIPIQIAYLP